jgi:hypothetical protein
MLKMPSLIDSAIALPAVEKVWVPRESVIRIDKVAFAGIATIPIAIAANTADRLKTLRLKIDFIHSSIFPSRECERH